jgi:hypothetical protein
MRARIGIATATRINDNTVWHVIRITARRFYDKACDQAFHLCNQPETHEKGHKKRPLNPYLSGPDGIAPVAFSRDWSEMTRLIQLGRRHAVDNSGDKFSGHVDLAISRSLHG